MRPLPTRFARPWYGLVPALAVTALVYLPGLSGGFVFDDFTNIVLKPALRVTNLDPQAWLYAAASGQAGRFGRPVSMFTFTVNYYLTGYNPFYFKLTNLVIHLLAGVLLFGFIRLLQGAASLPSSAAGRVWLAPAVTAAWLLHPIQLTSVLYVVQRMTSLSALFCLASLICYLQAHRLQERPGWRYPAWLAGVGLTGVLAVLSKENGALLPFYILLMEWLLLPPPQTPLGIRRRRLALSIFVILPLGVAAAYLATHVADILAPYRHREFSLAERLLTESRVLVFYLAMIVTPATARLGLFHDDFPLSHGFLDPPGTLLAILALSVLAAAAVALRRQAPVFAFGVLWFFAGHLLESGFIGLEIAHEHRNYLPSLGVIFVVIYYLFAHPYKMAPHRRALATAGGLLLLLFGVNTYGRAQDWGDPLIHAYMEVEHHPGSARAHYQLASVLGEIAMHRPRGGQDPLYKSAMNHYRRAARLNPRSVTAWVSAAVTSYRLGRPPPPNWVDRVTRRLKLPLIDIQSGAALYSLSRCRQQGVCELPPETFRRLLEAALRNDNAPRNVRVILLAIAADAYANQLHDYASAIGALNWAVALAPEDARLRLNYGRLLYALKDYPAAKVQLETARRLDRWGGLEKEIAPLLAEIRTAHTDRS